MKQNRSTARMDASEPAAWLGADAEPLDMVFIDGFVGQTVIGIDESEFVLPQPVVIDLALGRRCARAGASDAIADTIDYGVLRQRLQRLMLEHRTTLLEALAERIAAIAIDEFAADRVMVRVAKPRKFDDVEAVGVQIERRRDRRPPAGATASDTVLRLIGRGTFPGSRDL